MDFEIKVKDGGAIELQDYIEPKAVINKLSPNSNLSDILSVNKQISKELENQRNTVKEMLVNKGVEVEESDKLTTLINKIPSIKGFPTGWDVEKSGEVMKANIKEGDPIIWQKYGDLETNVERMADTPNVTTSGEYFSSISPDGSLYAIALSYSPYLKLYRYNDNTFTEIPLPSNFPTYAIRRVKFSRDNKYMAVSGNSANYTYIWKIEGNVITLVNTINRRGYDFDFSPDSKYLALCGYNSSYVFGVFKIDESVGISPYCGGYSFTSTTGSFPTQVKFSPSGRCAYFFGNDDYYSIYFDIATEKATNYYAGIRCYSMCFSNNGKYMYLFRPLGVSSKIRVYTYDEDLLAQGKGFMTQVAEFSVVNTITNMTFDSTSTFIAIGTSDTACILCNVNEDGTLGATLKTIESIATPSRNIQFSDDGRLLFVSSNDKYFYRLDNKEIVSPYDLKHYSFIHTKNRYVGVAMESKNIGEQIKVNCFGKLNLGGVEQMIQRINILESRIATLEESDKAILRGDMQTVAYNNYPEDFEDVEGFEDETV